MKLHRDLDISQRHARMMLHKIRYAMNGESGFFRGTVEFDETYMGGIEKNKHKDKKLNAGRGGVGKAAVVGVKDRNSNKITAQVVENTKRTTLHGFIEDNVEEGSTVMTDDFVSYQELDEYKHLFVKHSAGEYVKGEDIHINGIESFWSMPKRAHKGTYHKISRKYLGSYVSELAGRHNIREFDTIQQMTSIVAGFIGKRLMSKQLVAVDADGRLF